MAEAASETKLVPKLGDRVKVVFHGYYEGEPLAGRRKYEIGSEHEVTEVGSDGAFFLDNCTWVLPEEIEVIQ